MINEVDILLDMYDDLIINIINIKNSKLRIEKNSKNIHSLNNNFFNVKHNDVILCQYLNIFEKYDESLKKLEKLLVQIEYHIKNKCSHEWVHDMIDIDSERSQQICYCVKCEITQK